MQVSQEGIDLTKEFESLQCKAYPDPKTGAAPYTIGWGTTRYPSGMPVRMYDYCTPEQADKYLANDLLFSSGLVNKYVTVPLTQGQFDAMVSIVYNVGEGSKYKDGIIFLKNGSPSTLLKMLNAKNYTGAADQFLRWVSPGTAVQAGLTRRRTAERALFLS